MVFKRHCALRDLCASELDPSEIGAKYEDLVKKYMAKFR
jgi:hypothetical protein